MLEKYPKYLPVGSIVLLKNAQKKLMIIGFCIISKENEGQMFDYAGCLYPEGLISSDQTAVFNHEQIQQIYAIGYSDEEEKKFKQKLNEEMKK